MAEATQEAKQETATDFDSQFNAAAEALDNQSQSSSDKDVKSAVGDQDAEKGTGVDQSKKANLEGDEKAYEEKKAKVEAFLKETFGDDLVGYKAYIKSLGFHEEPAWQKLMERAKKSGIDENTQKELAEFKEVVNSAEFIRTKMEKQGYKPEAIDAELKRRGYEVQDNQSDLTSVVEKALNLNPQQFASQEEYERTKAVVHDVTKIVEIALKNSIPQYLNKEISPIADTVTTIQQKESASQNVKVMQGIVSSEGILDWEKEVEPELNKFLDYMEAQGKEINQDDIVDYFHKLNHRLTIEKLQTKGRKEERDVKRGNLRTNTEGVTQGAKPPKKTGNFELDFNAMADHIGSR